MNSKKRVILNLVACILSLVCALLVTSVICKVLYIISSCCYAIIVYLEIKRNMIKKEDSNNATK